GFIALTEHQPVYTPLETTPERLKKHGNQNGCEERNNWVSLCLKQSSKQDREKHIQSDDTGGEDGVDQSAVKNEINIPQPMTPDSQTKGEGQREKQENIE